MTFVNRREAGQRLAEALERYRDDETVVLALPRGGLAVALPIAEALNAPLDLLLVRKIGVPFEPEVAMGAVLEGNPPVVVRLEETIRELQIAHAVFEAEKDRALKELARRMQVYRRGRPLSDVHGKTVVLVDDGIATGATVTAALAGLRRLKPDAIVLAVPVAPRRLFARLATEADTFVCLDELGRIGTVSLHYDHFEQLSDEDVIALLEKAPTTHVR